jgi:hypothetical protein
MPRPRAQDLRLAARRGERGVSLILAMLVLFVLAVLVVEISYNAHVELDHAKAFVQGKAMGALADAARRQAESTLIVDVEQSLDTSGAGDGGGGGDMFGPGGPPMADDPGEEPSEEEESIADTTARTDSRLDEWNDPLSMAPSFGGGSYSVYVEVEDEDGKINLLGLWSPEKDLRDGQREVVQTLLDKAFEGTSLDLSISEASEILDRLDDWVRGNRGSYDSIPLPPLKPTLAEDDAAEGDQLDAAVLDNNERHLPLTLGELAMIEGLEREHLTGFVEYDEFHPGLDRYLTLWTELEVKPAPPAVDPFSGSPFTGFTEGSLFDKELGETGPETDTGEQEDEPEDIAPDPTNNGLVNVNTAPEVVLRALAPVDIPNSFLERVEEFRDRIDELRESGALSATDSLFSDSALGSGEDGGSSSSSDDDDDDITKYVFESSDEVISKVEEHFGITLGLDPSVQNTFVTRLGVTSQVFTIKILVYSQVQNERTGRMEFGQRRAYRTVVWRMVTAEGARTLTLLPLEAYPDARRMRDYGDELGEFGDEHVAHMQEQGIRF